MRGSRPPVTVAHWGALPGVRQIRDCQTREAYAAGHRQRYAYHACGQQFDDLTDTILKGHHHPLRTWVLGLYFMSLNLSNEQIAAELDVAADTVQDMATQLRASVVAKKSPSA